MVSIRRHGEQEVGHHCPTRTLGPMTHQFAPFCEGVAPPANSRFEVFSHWITRKWIVKWKLLLIFKSISWLFKLDNYSTSTFVLAVYAWSLYNISIALFSEFACVVFNSILLNVVFLFPSITMHMSRRFSGTSDYRKYDLLLPIILGRYTVWFIQARHALKSRVNWIAPSK